MKHKPKPSRGNSIVLFKRESIRRENNQPYLERLIIFRCKWFGILLHRFLASDDTREHDHPWFFWSWILKGGYNEWTPAIDGVSPADGGEKRVWYNPLSFLYRPAKWIHRVELAKDEKGRDKQATTIIIHGPKERSWGFWTPLGWAHWLQYSFANYCS